MADKPIKTFSSIFETHLKKQHKPVEDTKKPSAAKPAPKKEAPKKEPPKTVKKKSLLKEAYPSDHDESKMAVPHHEKLADLEGQFAQTVKDKLITLEGEVLAYVKECATQAKNEIPGVQTKFRKIARQIFLEQAEHLFT